MNKSPKLEHFLQFFPEVELPVAITEESVTVFDARNDVLPKSLIEQFIIPWENSKDIDEYTEFVPCFRLPDSSDDYHAVVYWKGGLMRYEYVLVTIDKRKGTLVTRKNIAGTIVENNILKKSVARIEEDFIIHIMAGASIEGEDYDGANSQAFNMEIMSTGDIIFSLDD